LTTKTYEITYSLLKGQFTITDAQELIQALIIKVKVLMHLVYNEQEKEKATSIVNLN